MRDNPRGYRSNNEEEQTWDLLFFCADKEEQTWDLLFLR